MTTERTPKELGLDPMLDITELAEYLGIPISTIYDWRAHGKGPRGHRIGRHLKFAVSDVKAWVEEHRERPADEQGRR